MKNIENLPEVTEQVLGGLQADMSLKHRILESAYHPVSRKQVYCAIPQPSFAFCLRQ